MRCQSLPVIVVALCAAPLPQFVGHTPLSLRSSY
jgi:hypothetical protein